MKIGIISGFILGVILIIVAGIKFLIEKSNKKKSKWITWVFLAGICALITAIVNAIKYLL